MYEAERKWTGKLLAGYNSHITILYKIIVLLAMTRSHFFCTISLYCEIILFHEHAILWFDDDGHVRGHLKSCFFRLNTHLLNLINFVEILWIVLPTKSNVQRITMLSQYMNYNLHKWFDCDGLSIKV